MDAATGMNQPSPSSFPGDLTTLEFIDQIGNTINAARPGDSLTMRGTDRPVLEMYARSQRLFRGIAALIEAKCYDSGMIVGRSLFEQTLRLMELAEAGSERTRLILSWAREGVQRDRRLVQVAQQMELAENTEPLWSALERRRQEVDQLQQRLGLGKLAKPSDEMALAKRLGLGDDFWTYEYMHHVVHGNPTPLREFIRPGGPENDIAVHIAAEMPQELLYLAALSSKLVLHSHLATAAILDWPIPQTVSEALAMTQEVLDQMALASEGSP